VQDRYLRYGLSKSCGCSRSAALTTHGLSGTYIYRAFFNAKYRCTKPSYPKFEYYGGRGIQFKFESAEQLASEVGPRPTPKHTLDRICNDGHYEPGNVQWATRTQQIKNRRKYGTLAKFSDTELIAEVLRRGITLK
jgi:hypothetical protein